MYNPRFGAGANTHSTIFGGGGGGGSVRSGGSSSASSPSFAHGVSRGAGGGLYGANSRLQPPDKPNVAFYKNKYPLPFPISKKIDEFLRTAHGDYRELERQHCYIQWLFPIAELSHIVVSEHYALTPEEIHEFNSDPEIMLRVHRSLALFLDFLGFNFAVQNGQQQTAPRAPGGTKSYSVTPHPRNFTSRAKDWISHSHNDKRITRMLKFLALVGLDAVSSAILTAFAEQIERGPFDEVADVYLDFWLPQLRDEAQRARLLVRVKTAIGEEVSSKELAALTAALEAKRKVPLEDLPRRAASGDAQDDDEEDGKKQQRDQQRQAQARNDDEEDRKFENEDPNDDYNGHRQQQHKPQPAATAGGAGRNPAPSPASFSAVAKHTREMMDSLQAESRGFVQRPQQQQERDEREHDVDYDPRGGQEVGRSTRGLAPPPPPPPSRIVSTQQQLQHQTQQLSPTTLRQEHSGSGAGTSAGMSRNNSDGTAMVRGKPCRDPKCPCDASDDPALKGFCCRTCSVSGLRCARRIHFTAVEQYNPPSYQQSPKQQQTSSITGCAKGRAPARDPTLCVNPACSRKANEGKSFCPGCFLLYLKGGITLSGEADPPAVNNNSASAAAASAAAASSAPQQQQQQQQSQSDHQQQQSKKQLNPGELPSLGACEQCKAPESLSGSKLCDNCSVSTALQLEFMAEAWREAGKATKPKGIVRFSNTSTEPFFELSNVFPVLLRNPKDGAIYGSAEAMFHAAKFLDTAPQVAELIRKAASAREAAELAQRHEQRSHFAGNNNVRRDWLQVQDRVLLDVLRAKFTQNTHCQRVLLASAPSELIFHTLHDTVFGDGGMFGRGENRLGRLLVQVRDEIKNGVPPTNPPVTMANAASVNPSSNATRILPRTGGVSAGGFSSGYGVTSRPSWM